MKVQFRPTPTLVVENLDEKSSVCIMIGVEIIIIMQVNVKVQFRPTPRLKVDILYTVP